MKDVGYNIIGFLMRVATVLFFVVLQATENFAGDYYSIQSLTDDVAVIDSGTGNVSLNLLFDGGVVLYNNSNGNVWEFNGVTLSGLNFSGKPLLTRISQSGTNGRLLYVDSLPNISFANFNFSSFNFTNTTPISGNSYNGGVLNIAGNNNRSRNAAFNNMIFADNKINVTASQNSPFSASGGGLYIDGGFVTTATEFNNDGKTLTLTKTDFSNNSVILRDLGYSLPRSNMFAAGGGASILHYDVVKIEEGNVINNSVTANIQGYVAGGGLALSGVRSGSVISKLNFANNSATILTDGEGTAYGGALFVDQQYSVTSGSNELLVPKTTIKIADTNFDANIAKNDGVGEAMGGAVVLLRDVDGIFDGVMFSGNSVSSRNSRAGGGAVAVYSFYQNSIPLSDSDKDNIKNQVTTFANTTFDDNTATSNSSSAFGGAIFATQRIETTKTDFTNNTAKGTNASGGAIAITRTDNSTFYDSTAPSRIRGGEFIDNQSIATGGESLGGAIYTSKGIEIISGTNYGNVLFQNNRATANSTNNAHGNSIFADAAVLFSAGAGSKIEDFDGHYITGNVTKVGGGILSLLGDTQHQAGGYFIREGVLRSGFTSVGESGFRAVANLYGRGATGDVVFDAGTIWELDLSNADMTKLAAGVQIADGEVKGASEAIRLGSTLVNVDVVDGKIKLIGVLDTARLSDIYASAAYVHKWNTVQNAVNSRINQLLYRYGTVQGEYLSGERTQTQIRGQSYSPHIAAAIPQSGYYNTWVNYVGRKSSVGSSFDVYDGEMLKSVSNGIQFGFDVASEFGVHLGFMFGYEDSRGKISNDEIQGDDYYVGAYGAMLFSYGFDVRGVLGFGHQRYKILRYDAGLGREFTVRPDGNSFEANIEFGRKFQTLHNFSVRPYISFDYLGNSVSSANEGLGGFRYDDLSVDQLFLRLGTDIQCHYDLLCLDAGVAFSQQLLDDYAKATVSQGTISSTLKTSRYGNSVFTFNIGANYSFDRFHCRSIFINYVGEVFVGGEAESINSLQTGFQWRF
ncbi:MAG: autotransporter domain-containing protein [Planctomycetaceae bacterium]|jgi:hypothetical protein|nr:autotransporter domain-containing protein [Planctomycetaceae bacterium]